jgi:hypothetical protein
MMKAIVDLAVVILLGSVVIASGQVLTQSDVTTGGGIQTGHVLTGPGGLSTGGDIIFSDGPGDADENPPVEPQEPPSWQTIVSSARHRSRHRGS